MKCNPVSLLDEDDVRKDALASIPYAVYQIKPNLVLKAHTFSHEQKLYSKKQPQLMSLACGRTYSDLFGQQRLSSDGIYAK